MKRGSNMPAVGTYNQTLVLDMIRRSPVGLSRTELAERTGLSAQTLGNVARRLAAEGFVVEGDRVVAGPGKPRTPLQLNRTARYAVGIHLDPVVDTFVVVDLSGSVIAHAERSPAEGAEAPELISALARDAHALLGSADVPLDRVLGIGVAVPGPIDHDTGTLLTPPLLPSWHHTRLRERLAEAAGHPVVVEKDVVAAMVGELWAEAEHALDDAALVYYGAGVGLGMAVDGEAVRGRTGNAGDIGHLLVDPGGQQCSCGSRGCLGVSIAPERLLFDAGVTPSPMIAPAAVWDAIDELHLRISTGDPRAVEVRDRAAGTFALALVLLNNLLDADTFVIGGPVWNRLGRALKPALDAALPTVRQSTATRPLLLREARLGTDLAAAGAASLVLDEAFTARPSDLMIGLS